MNRINQLTSRFRFGNRKSGKKKTHGTLVAIIHGIAVPNASMLPLSLQLERKYQRRTYIHKFQTWTRDIPAIAEGFAKAIEAKGVKELDVVTHSMGALILRWAHNNFDLPRLRRVVMIAPPNAGAQIAKKFDNTLGPLFPLIFGPCALQTRPGNEGIVPLAGTLNGVEVGVIAGGSGSPRGLQNVFGLEGDNDRIIRVEETILPGMKDFILLRHNHSGLVISSQTAHMVNLFLEHGVFRPRIDDGIPEENEAAG